jgi:antitoxin (DNA-binding transcriptional repressor) of toxin-antitoxin stability system
MRLVTVRELRGNSARVWRELSREKEMVLTSHGRPIGLLCTLDEASLEESLWAWRRARAAQALTAIQRASLSRGSDRLSARRIEAEIGKVRRSRRAGRR